MTYVYLTAEDVLAIAEDAVDDQRIAVRDAGLLESAVHRPSASMFGQEAYADLFDKAAALLQSLAVNHPFVDGNKRTAWVSCVVFLALNGVQLRPDIDAAEHLVIAVATGRLDEVKAISEALRDLAE
ncbi:type II toxin-antitoxin system death-on-curing family toxin [Streptomyces sp. RO-S4]|uniref:type II toxin-antitoxin system death-on-curing family toxin n=1 Tax=unclassified Streptomyces TaxID=2593676 RepID=UPI00208DF9BC|nr:MULTISPECIES: type II toxin-antitoxin system death-on-curing family toxin [unclassified Streptomyces]MCO4699165.1 type II toxin-antitoxin system death-on-curing family toxin [Streptomyces sp. RO-S4]MDU0300226.1 type II toxin-antitoxin system death-on-curing family toxin [Streptomyces sp. PAL114]